MVKRLLVWVGSSALVVAVVLVAIALMKGTEPPDSGVVSCPIYFATALGDALPKDHVASRWQIYRYDGEKGTAEVKVSVSTTATPSRPYSCRLTIMRAPEAPGAASDWRIGQVVKPDAFQGKTIRYRVAIKTDREMRLDTGQIYMYDGQKVEGAAISNLTPEWRTFEAKLTVDPKATTFEVWVRLLLDKGTVQPGSGTLYFVPEVEIQKS